MNDTNVEIPDTSYTKVDHYSKKKLYVNKDRMKSENLKVKKPRYKRSKEKYSEF